MTQDLPEQRELSQGTAYAATSGVVPEAARADPPLQNGSGLSAGPIAMPDGIEVLEYAKIALEKAAAATGNKRDMFLLMAHSFRSSAAQIAKSKSRIAVSRELLADVERLLRRGK